ncbi:MAG: hypothetical protein EOS20_27335 [Mesorhizobium sp.]|nr:MAG: hypothetical protein EOS20_27335 [Mesorhizobium sp.]
MTAAAGRRAHRLQDASVEMGAPATMTGQMIYFAGAVLAAYGGAGHSDGKSIVHKRRQPSQNPKVRDSTGSADFPGKFCRKNGAQKSTFRR